MAALGSIFRMESMPENLPICLMKQIGALMLMRKRKSGHAKNAMDNIEKFLRGVPHLRKRLSMVLRMIRAGNLTGLDIKPMKGQEGVFRCRVGQVRILFLRKDGMNIPFAVGFRGDIY